MPYMPQFLVEWCKSLTDEQANELAQWFDGGFDTDMIFAVLIQPRPKLHREWNVRKAL